MILLETRKYIVPFVALIVISTLLNVLKHTDTLAQQATPQRVTIKLSNGAKPIPPGPFKPTWESIRTNYKVPRWFRDGKFGIMMHWGLYSVPAKQSEWYARHMYSNAEIAKWHTEKFGLQDTFGYKDFVRFFKAEKFDPGACASLFKKAGATYVVPVAEHHDGFAMYDSALTRWDVKDMGPQRDLIGELARAVRKEGLKFGLSNHRMEHWSFMYPRLNIKHDLFDPAYADFYGPPQPPRGTPEHPDADEAMGGVNAPQSKEFLEEWLMRVQELIDKYQPDMLWFDNGVNSRQLDPVKLRVAAYYYNRARQWRKDVSLSTKADAYLAGSIRDFERQNRAPRELTDYVWQVDDPVLYRFGYTENSPISNADTVVHRLVENVSRNGALLLNISPKADGAIPDDQKNLLLEIGAWLSTNGEAIYGTRPWTSFAEGVSEPTGTQSLGHAFRFTTKGDTLYALALAWPGDEAVITSLSTNKAATGKVASVKLLGHSGALKFTRDETGLKIKMPLQEVGRYVYVLKITGLKL